MTYDIDRSLPCDPRLYMPGRMGVAVDHIVVHYTADAGSAWANAEYARRGKDGDPRISSFHYVIDSSSIFLSVEEHDTAWHAGDDAMSMRSIGIEVCSLGEDFTVGEIARLSWLVQDVMRRYGIPPERVIRHYDVTGKMCPAPYAPNGSDPTGEKWTRLHATITGGMGEELPMEFIGRANQKETLKYFCGTGYREILRPEDSEAIQALYKQIHGSSIPMIEGPRVANFVRVIDDVNDNKLR